MIDGKALADTLLSILTTDVIKLKSQGITPTLAVILVGNNPGSLSYIKQKQKIAVRIGAHVIFHHQPSSISDQQLQSIIKKFNVDPNVHGLIVQRPVPRELGDVTDILNTVNPQKDVDGFTPNSPFPVPVAQAVMTILNHLSDLASQGLSLQGWTKNKNIFVIGRGETSGKPIAELLQKKDCKVQIVHSHTPQPTVILKTADVIISCVGKPNIVTKDMIKPGVILMSVGIWRDDNGKLHGDYEEDDIKDIASFYTPTPGGVGPVNVACLMQNLIKASTIKQAGQI